MEEILDIIWFKIVDLIQYLAGVCDIVFKPLNFLGPGFAIFILAILAMVVSRLMSRYYQPKRYLRLKKDFIYWYNLRNEALTCGEAEKGKRLARNIDQAKLNKVYYDYFFENLMRNLFTKYLPWLIMAAYVNDAFRTERLQMLFGREYIIKLGRIFGGYEISGAVFWYVLCLIIASLTFYLLKSKVLLKWNRQPA